MSADRMSLIIRKAAPLLDEAAFFLSYNHGFLRSRYVVVQNTRFMHLYEVKSSPLEFFLFKRSEIKTQCFSAFNKNRYICT